MSRLQSEAVLEASSDQIFKMNEIVQSRWREKTLCSLHTLITCQCRKGRLDMFLGCSRQSDAQGRHEGSRVNF